MIVRLLDSALEDLDRAKNFYERQGEGLGAYFLDTLFSEIDSLVSFAGIHRKVLGYHRLLSKRFSYRVEDEHEAVVWRVLDLRQAPSKIRRALR